jgi:hypothetical protein
LSAGSPEKTKESVMKRSVAPIQFDRIVDSILVFRGQRILLDTELSILYGVSTKRLNEQVKRNKKRFPEDFVFRLTREEIEVLNRSQFATGSQKHRDPRFRQMRLRSMVQLWRPLF